MSDHFRQGACPACGTDLATNDEAYHHVCGLCGENTRVCVCLCPDEDSKSSGNETESLYEVIEAFAKYADACDPGDCTHNPFKRWSDRLRATYQREPKLGNIIRTVRGFRRDVLGGVGDGAYVSVLKIREELAKIEAALFAQLTKQGTDENAQHTNRSNPAE